MVKNEALREFLIARRAAITPEMAGIKVSGTRRVPGLRREEVAVLASVSSDWYARLEQGRQVTPSESVLSAIADVLQLDDAERDYLFNLARPGSTGRFHRERPTVRPGITRMLQAFDKQPAFVLGPRMDVLAGNALVWALLDNFPAKSLDNRNLLRWIITEAKTRELYLDWDTIASELVGVLQLEASANPKDGRIKDLVTELRAASPEFSQWWLSPNPRGRTSGTKRFNHPVVGPLHIDWEAFVVPDDPTQTMFVYTASNNASEESLRLLGSWWATEAVTSGTADP
jgi:transcriptional regulator with XRE-family HTH domain